MTHLFEVLGHSPQIPSVLLSKRWPFLSHLLLQLTLPRSVLLTDARFHFSVPLPEDSCRLERTFSETLPLPLTFPSLLQQLGHSLASEGSSFRSGSPSGFVLGFSKTSMLAPEGV